MFTTVLHFIIHYKTFHYLPGSLTESIKVAGGFLLGLPHTATYFGQEFFSCGPMWYLLALLVAIELVMKMVGLGSVPVGPLYMSFLTLPIAVGAITMGPAVGALLGGVFGAVSFYDAITGASAMTGALFQVSPVNTFILCVGMRVLMGLCCGLIFSGLKRFDKPGTWSYIVSAMSAPFLNTVFFMGWIVLAFYGCDYVQNLVSVKGAANPFMFVVLLVGVQGVAEFLVSGILGGIVARAVAKFVK